MEVSSLFGKHGAEHHERYQRVRVLTTGAYVGNAAKAPIAVGL